MVRTVAVNDAIPYSETPVKKLPFPTLSVGPFSAMPRLTAQSYASELPSAGFASFLLLAAPDRHTTQRELTDFRKTLSAVGLRDLDPGAVLAVPDFASLNDSQVAAAIRLALEVGDDARIAVTCFGGKGRSGQFLALVAVARREVPASQAVAYVRALAKRTRYTGKIVETPEQENAVLRARLPAP